MQALDAFAPLHDAEQRAADRLLLIARVRRRSPARPVLAGLAERQAI